MTTVATEGSPFHYPCIISIHIIAHRYEMKENDGMTATTVLQHCAYPGCDKPPAAPGSDRGARPKYCDDPAHNPLSAHRERRKREAGGQRAEEAGGQPVTLGLTRAGELVRALEKLTVQHADTLARAIAELRAAGDVESAEAEVYAARASADQRVATAEARLAEEIQRRRDAEAGRDAARDAREEADAAAAQAIARMDDLEREIAELRASTQQEVRQVRASAEAEVRQARDSAQQDISAARKQAGRQVADAEARTREAEQDAARARQAETAAVARADHAQAAAADEAGRIRADHQRALDQLTAATAARITALEETRDALRVRAERAESDLDAARAETRRLAEELNRIASAVTDPAGAPEARPPAPARARKTTSTRAPRAES